MASSRKLKVAVIGAGPSGLVTARELNREGHRVVIYEKQSRLGGIWVYDPRVESDPLGLDPDRDVVHSSLYLSLRTNLPRDLMGFSDYPFFSNQHDGDPRNFPGHQQVLKFLEGFALHMGLIQSIRFNQEVVRVERLDSGDWIVESRNAVGMPLPEEEAFDAVVVCNGHHTHPRPAHLPGGEKWPGKQIHSHNYRVPEPYRDQIVVVIGSGASGQDICREIATVAKQVHISIRSPPVQVSKLISDHPNIWHHPKISYLSEDGKVVFEDGFSIHADTILHCTGYAYHFPFLKVKGMVSVEDNRVGPLYMHVFPPQLAPTLSFVGITVRAIIFRTLELQAKWVARVLSGKVELPSEETMMCQVEQHYKRIQELGIPQHQTHFLDPFQFDYVDWLASEAGTMPVEESLKNIFRQLIEEIYVRKDNGTLNRDEWSSQD